MAEYLAPGVYVEETSFRAKSIEGVGTSTTAFVGPARKGPVAQRADASPPPTPPELITSFGEFVRVFGGLEPLDFAPSQPNYLAHAVLNYFNEGGGRLYVVRVAQGAGSARLQLAGADDVDANRVALKARFSGSAGNGRVTVREILSSANGKSMSEAPPGTLLRGVGALPTEPARLTGKAAPFSVREGGILRLQLKGGPQDLVFHGRSTEAMGDTDLVDNIVLDDASRTLSVSFNGAAPQVIVVPTNDHTPQSLALAVGTQLNGGYARLEGKKLVIGTDQRGFGGLVKVLKSDKFGFTADQEQDAAFDLATNNVGNLANVTVDDLNEIIDQPDNTAKVVASTRADGVLVLATKESGQDASLGIVDATDPVAKTVSEHHAFGLEPLGPAKAAAKGSNVRVFAKRADQSWMSADNVPFPAPADPAEEAGSLISLAITVEDASGDSDIFDDLSLAKGSPRYAGTILSQEPRSRAESLRQLVRLDIGDAVEPLALHAALFSGNAVGGSQEGGLAASHRLEGGTDGSEPSAGTPSDNGSYAAGLEQLSGLEDISIVAAPGHASFNAVNYQAIQRLLQQHVERPRAYRIGVLETPPGLTSGQARAERARIDSHRLALYYPWVTVANPLARPGSAQPKEINLPPSGFICGIYARNDVEHDVSKSPANEVVRGALRFESDVNFAQNQLLNPLGVNCLRYFPGRGYRVWGARTASSDPEWKYVNVRRYFNYLEASIDRGTQWAVFDNNGPRLWQNIRETIEDFLYNEWVSNRLLGDSPKQAYFVRCDRSTMTQNDLDNGRLICLIGVAALKPAEFVIFRIGQKTADTRS